MVRQQLWRRAGAGASAHDALQQVIDKVKKELLLGEAKIETEIGVIFNMTPSPGATSCLGNAEVDAKLLCDYLGVRFYADKFKKELE